MGTVIRKVEQTLPEEHVAQLAFWQLCMLLTWIKTKSHGTIPPGHYIQQQYEL